MNTNALLDRKNSKSAVPRVFGFGVSTVEAPVPSNCLWKKSKELPVMVSTVAILSLAPTVFSHVGLKSTISVNGNSPVGSGSSGSTLVAVYVGISSYPI